MMQSNSAYGLREFGVDDAGGDGVHAHVVGGELDGEHFGHLQQRGLRHAVRGEARKRPEASHRRHEQDAAAAARQQAVCTRTRIR